MRPLDFATYIDRFPVTNAEYKKFLDGSKYRPRDTHNFLQHWSSGTYPPGLEDKPVVWVSIEDARAYAAWTGKRLPHEWEWQYAAVRTGDSILGEVAGSQLLCRAAGPQSPDART